MPELPEVEVTRRSVAGIAGARVRALHIGKPLRWPLGCEPAALVGTVAGAMSRRGKYLWLPLTSAQPEAGGGLLWHLGMSGSLSFGTSLGPAGPHDHVELQTDRGVLRLTDPRRFGAVVWALAPDQGLAARLLAKLGREPFDPSFDAVQFHAALQGRRTPIKAALLAGDVVVGAGNIYACEALHAAGIDPRTPCSRIGPARAERLLDALRQVLAAAIDAGGSTLRDFRDAYGHAGSYQTASQVYGRAGERCTRCGGTIRRLVQAQRSTYYCPGCQFR